MTTDDEYWQITNHLTLNWLTHRKIIEHNMATQLTTPYVMNINVLLKEQWVADWNIVFILTFAVTFYGGI